MSEKQIILDRICMILKGLDTHRTHPITAEVDIITQLDFDSLKMFDLVAALNEAFGINFLQDPYSINDLKSPETIATAVLNARASQAR